MELHRAALLLGLLLAPPALGAAPGDEATAVVRETLSAAQAVADAPGTRDEKLESLRAVARKILDTRAMAQRAGGEALSAQTRERQEEYFELFDHVIVRAYLSKLLLFRKPRFEYGEPRREGDVVFARTRIVTSKDAYNVDYEMRQRDGRWVATDVIFEGVSLSDNYRDQFASLLRGRSFEELLELMRRKTRGLRKETS